MVDKDPRRQQRIPVTMQARLRDRSLGRFDAHIIDLSVSGFRAEADYSFDPGQTVWLTIPGLQGLEATVSWRRGLIVGCAFNQPLHPAVLDHIVKSTR